MGELALGRILTAELKLRVKGGTTRRPRRRGPGGRVGLGESGTAGVSWCVKELAQQVGMSRSIFALKFKEKVGETPMEYLTRWRMLLAGDRLTSSAEPVLEIAMSLGYESESAFGKAFKRVMGCSPRRYGRQRDGRGMRESGGSGVGVRQQRSPSAGEAKGLQGVG